MANFLLQIILCFISSLKLSLPSEILSSFKTHIQINIIVIILLVRYLNKSSLFVLNCMPYSDPSNMIIGI